MLGYCDAPDLTAEVMAGGWFRTGDIGRIDSDGFLHITGRVKNMILSSNGKNVYPEEIEERIKMNPLIEEAVVYAGEGGAITLEYYASGGEVPGVAEFVEGVNDNLPMYAQISKIAYRPNPFPKTSTQKIQRAQTQTRCG
jgi:long-chain acyl-CoA synthetase